MAKKEVKKEERLIWTVKRVVKEASVFSPEVSVEEKYELKVNKRGVVILGDRIQ